MVKCQKCNEKAVYKEVLRNNGDVTIKAVCKKNHKVTIEDKVQRNRTWFVELAKNILTCVKCGERVRPARRDELKDKGDNFLIPVYCPSGCKNDDRLVDKQLAGGIRDIIRQMRSMKPLKPIGRPFIRSGFRGMKPSGMGMKPAGKVRVTYRIPDTCPSCKAPINSDDVHWIGPMEAKCNYCNAQIIAKETEI